MLHLYIAAASPISSHTCEGADSTTAMANPVPDSKLSLLLHNL